MQNAQSLQQYFVIFQDQFIEIMGSWALFPHVFSRVFARQISQALPSQANASALLAAINQAIKGACPIGPLKNVWKDDFIWFYHFDCPLKR